ncbi:glutamine synthetase family protein [Legionella cincinnatiensis]|uniref:Glutamine synthase n=1 Tax=Legionella cincinnatiensis TaxID=28085 RepID=A0A378IL27_9GAMM|nr:glutamine synthetase [Legionella cincinnatiensis]KTC83013.1 glutamine synthase [Legionella cincinnatiensis]STX35796.1 glutamine synthase [Legionella cincinnatiensis]
MLTPKDIKTIEAAKQIVKERDLSHVKVGLFDVDGIMRGKYMSRDKFFSALDNGFSFCNVILGWDSKDKLYDNGTYTGWDTGYPDTLVRILPETCRDLIFEENQLLFMAEFAGDAEVICPRALLRRVIQKAAAMGFEAYAALEYEFFMFDETPESIRAKGFRDLKPITPDFFGYSMLRNSVHADLYHQILEMGEVMNFPIESLHAESGPGVIEAAITVDKIGVAGDKAALFKTFMKVLAQRNHKMATFMAKWSPQYPGQSGHIHLSLRHKEGGSAFYDPSRPHNMSKLQRHFIAGQQKLIPELLAMVSPTVNSFTRLIPGFWAPTNATWGIENRTAALRVIPGNDKSQRIEYRLGSADANPYLALAVALGSGLYGIEQELELNAEVRGNSYVQSYQEEQTLPQTVGEASIRLKESTVARSLFGDPFVEHFAATREWEEREFRRHITDWELDRYFEII